MPVALGVNGGVLGSNNLPSSGSAKGIWTPNEIARAVALGFWPVNYARSITETATGADVISTGANADPYFNLTTLLLSTTATNGQQNNTFQDSSTNNFTITRNPATGPNAPTQGTFSPFSQTGWVNYFNGSYLTVPSGADFNLGTNDFCIEFWLNPIAPATYGGILTFDDGDYPLNFSYASTNSSNVQANFGTTTAWLYSAFFDTSTATNEWAHYVATRSGSTFRLFKNGVLKATGTSSGTIGNSSSNLRINANGGSAGTTYISNLRIINGSIPTTYQTSSTTTGTTIFAVPTSPLTTTSQGAIAADVKLLTCQSNRFIDNSTANPKTISVVTANSTPSTVPFSPFNPTSAWSASTVGGSGYFDGTGDQLTESSSALFSMGTGQFTIEFWVYRTASAFQTLFTSNSGSTSIQMFANTGNTAELWISASQLTSNFGSLALNSWNHVAVVRDGSSNMSAYVNGVRGYTAVRTDNLNNVGIQVGGRGSNYLSGYISGFRWVSGADLYSGTAFTVPTSPPTATPSSGTTVLLLNFTNSGIYDATAKNVLETVGNAQVSTTQSKWSPTSMSFDGTGDYLLIPDNPSQRIGTGNFTVECWVYRNASGTYGLIGKGTGTTGWLLSLNSSNQVVFTYGSSTITSTGTISATTWTHIAVVRSGTGANLTKIYISGTNDGTGTVSTDFNQTNAMYVAADRTGGSNANAYVQDTRVTLYARYSANFTPPTAAFPVQ